MKKSSILVLLFAFAVGILSAQEEIRFGRYTVVPEQNVKPRTRGEAARGLIATEPVNGRVNVLVQFKKAQVHLELHQLRQAGVALDGYVGGNAYFAQLSEGIRVQDLARLGAVSVIDLQPEWKVSSLLEEGRVPLWARRDSGRVAVKCSWFANVDADFVRCYAQARGYAVDYVSQYFSSATLELLRAEVMALASEPWVRHVGPVPPPEVLLNREAATLSGGSVLSLPPVQGGRALRGEGVRIGLWDGNVERHVDFGDRLHVQEYNYSVAESESHGIHTAGTIAGEGLLNPNAQGIAPRAELYSMNFRMFPDEQSDGEEMLEARRKYNITLTSNSYGPSLERLCPYYNELSYSYLGSEAERDRLAFDEPTLTHIYAAGNDQGLCNGYKYGSSASRAKNVIYVGAVDKHGRMSKFSSWGPMDDGRLIPTVSAKGVGTLSTVHGNGYKLMDGTSMACPAVSGHVALLAERYHQLHGGQHPHAALVKGLLANTADDRGNVGPDYQYGYGVVNAPAALTALENKWYAVGRVQRGSAAKPVQIDVPQGVKQLRVMLTWLDPAPAVKEFAYGEKALVNDLDLSVSAGGVATLPYVLNPTTPDAPATRGVDDCNNIEQVVIDNPVAGIAEAIIRGHDKIHDGEEQEYVLTWYFYYGAPALLCPIGGEAYSPGDEMLVRADGLDGKVTVEISYDDGESYHFVASTRDGVEFYSISVPVPSNAPNTNRARLRLTDAAGQVLVSPHTFTVARRPENLEFRASGCDATSWRLAWSAANGVEKYAVLRADVASGEWREVGEVAVNSYSIPASEAALGGRAVYAVAAKLGESAYGPRSRGVLAQAAVPRSLKVEDLPFYETFTALPMDYATVEVGDSLLLEYADTPSDFGLPLGSRMLVVTTLRGSAKTMYTEPNNMLTVRMCKLNLRGVPAGTPLLFYANALLEGKGSLNLSQLRLRANGAEVPLANGKTSISAAEAATAIYWDVSSYAGQEEVTLELQYSSHAILSRLYLLGYALQEASPLPDVGVYVSGAAVESKPRMGVEKLVMTVYNSSLNEVNLLPIVVRLDGEVKSSFVVKALGPYEQRQVEVPVDFTSPSAMGHIFKVEVQVSVPGDVDLDDNTRQFEVYSMGDVLAHPSTGIFEIPGFIRQRIDPKLEVPVDGAITYVDMGGSLQDYLPEQEASIRFYPIDPTKSVMLTFKLWSLDTPDKVEVYTTALAEAFDYDNATAACELESESEGKPMVLVSSAADGSLYVRFISGGRSAGGRGWEAEVTTVERSNALSLLPLKFESYYEDGQVPLQIEVENKSRIDISGAKAVVTWGAGENVSVVEIDDPLPAAQSVQVELGNLEFAIPSLTDLEVNLVSQQDLDGSDNTQRVYVRNDYLWGGGEIAKPIVGIEYVYASSQTASFEVEKQCNARLDYNTEEVELPFYTRTVNPLFVKLTQAVPAEMLPGWVHVWINDDDQELTNGAPDFYAKIPLAAGKEEYDTIIDVSEFSEGSHRMRIAIFKDGDLERFVAGETVQYGRVTDVIAEITDGENAYSHDLSIEITPIASGANLSKEQKVEVNITNLGYSEARDVKVTLAFDGGTPIEEVVAGPIAPFGAAPLRYTFAQTADLSGVGSHTIEVALVESDGNDFNNEAKIELFSLPVPKSDALYTLDFQGKGTANEAIDFSRVSSVQALNATDALTLEGWFYLRGKQNAVLFETSSLIVGTAKNRREVPDNSLIVLVGNNQRCYSKLPVLAPGQFHHVVVSLATVPGQLGYTSKVTAFVDGKPVELVQRGEDVTIFGDLKAATNLNGQVKMVRFWNRGLSEHDISEFMQRSVRDEEGNLADGCVAEFMMNEGQLQYLVSGRELALIESARVDNPTDNIWRGADRLIAGTHFDGQLRAAEQKSRGEWEVTMPYNVDESGVKGDILTLWAGTEVTYKGKVVDENTVYNFAEEGGKIAITARYSLFGVPVEEKDVVIRLKKDLSHECSLLKLGLSGNANLKAPLEVDVTGETVKLRIEDKSTTERVDLSRMELQLVDFSAGANVVYIDSKGTIHESTSKGDKIIVDLTKPIVLTVIAANHSIKSYTVKAVRVQEVQWEVTPLELQFATATVQLNAKSSSARPVSYRALDEHVATVDALGKLHTAGVGETTVYAYVPEGDGYAKSNVLERHIVVTPAPLIVRPAVMDVEEGSEIPEVKLEFDGLLFGEAAATFKSPQYAVYQDASTEWTPDMPPLAAGDYEVRPIGYTEPYRDGNYMVTLQSGKLRVKPAVDNRLISFIVADGRSASPIVEAAVEVDGVLLKTDAQGKTQLYRPRGHYSYTVRSAGYADMHEELELGDEDVSRRVALNVLGAEVRYAAGEHGTIAGIAVQRPAYGDYGSEVVAVPDAGYEFAGWSDGLKTVSRRDKGQAAPVTYTASFNPKSYKLTYIIGEGGELVQGEREQQVAAGAIGEAIGVKASAGWFFAGWSDGVTLLERRDAAEGNMIVEAHFYRAYALPFIESFDAASAKQLGWTFENYSNHPGAATWRIGVKSTYPAGDLNKAFMDANAAAKDARNDAALLTPWISLHGFVGDLELSFDWYYKAEKKERVGLQYRLVSGEWQDVGLTLEEEQEGARITCDVPSAKLGGEYVQFRWRYEAGWGYGVAVDNVMVRSKDVAQVEYVAGVHGVVRRVGSTAAGEARIVLKGSELGESIIAEADAGYRFVGWSDGLQTPTRSDRKVGRFDARFGKQAYTLAYDGGEGQIEGPAFQQVEKGGAGASVFAVAPSGMALLQWSDGIKTNPRRDVNVEKDVYVVAEYEDAYTVVYGVEGEGVLVAEVNGVRLDAVACAVVEGTEVHFVAEPAEGYRVKSWEGVSPASPEAVDAHLTVNEDVNVKVYFEKQLFRLAYSAAASEGRIEGESEQTVAYGEDGTTVSAVPNVGYHFVRWSDGVATASRAEQRVRGAVDVHAEFGREAHLELLVQCGGAAVEGVSVALGGYGEKITDGEGRVLFIVAAGEYSYAVSKEGVGQAAGTVKVDVAGSSRTIALTPLVAATLRFVVRDDAGAVQGATVSVGSASKQTGERGEALFENLPLQQYSYTVSKSGYVTERGEKELVAGGSVVEVKLRKETTGVGSELLDLVALRPNPARGEVYVGNAEAVQRVRVVTLWGSVLQELRNETGESEIRVALDGVAEGVYLLEVEGARARRTLRFTVIR